MNTHSHRHHKLKRKQERKAQPKQQDKKIKGSWVFGIYNIYNLRNAATISFKQDPETGKNQAYKLSIFGIIPSVTYNIRF